MIMIPRWKTRILDAELLSSFFGFLFVDLFLCCALPTTFRRSGFKFVLLQFS
jgi:hypothetical protein